MFGGKFGVPSNLKTFDREYEGRLKASSTIHSCLFVDREVLVPGHLQELVVAVVACQALVATLELLFQRFDDCPSVGFVLPRLILVAADDIPSTLDQFLACRQWRGIIRRGPRPLDLDEWRLVIAESIDGPYGFGMFPTAHLEMAVRPRPAVFAS